MHLAHRVLCNPPVVGRSDVLEDRSLGLASCRPWWSPMLAANRGWAPDHQISLSTELAYVAIFLLGFIGFLAD